MTAVYMAVSYLSKKALFLGAVAGRSSSAISINSICMGGSQKLYPLGGHPIQDWITHLHLIGIYYLSEFYVSFAIRKGNVNHYLYTLCDLYVVKF